MCIIIGKWFPKLGWVGIKNRDRNYTPEISFRKKHHDHAEILYFWDNITQYCEGINSAGVSVLSASLMVKDDEKEIMVRARTPSKDGTKIKTALKEKHVLDVAHHLVHSKLPGNTIIFDQNTMVLLEGSWLPGEYENRKYTYKIQVVPQSESVVRTNHGIWLPWAGYQRNPSDMNQTKSRISSECRLLIAQQAVLTSHTPMQLMNALTLNYTHNPQLNALRTTHAGKKMRTTSQIMLVPHLRCMYVRPVQSDLNFDFWKWNHPKAKTWVEILSNRALYAHHDAGTHDNSHAFRHALSHSIT